jgi:methionyl-tRNA formyltransferase
MKIIFAGNGLRANVCINYLIKKKYNIVGLIGHPKEKTDEFNFKSIKNLSYKYELPFINPKNINSYKTFLWIKKFDPDLIILCGYSNNILKKKLLDYPNYGAINLHASPLPFYRGGSPLNWMIINNLKKIGISIIKADDGIDTGDILDQKFFKFSQKKDINDLIKKVNSYYPSMLVNVLKKIKQNNLFKKSQKNRKFSFYPKRKPEDGLINFKEMTSLKIYNYCRALKDPFPGAYFFYDKKKIKILECVAEKEKPLLKKNSYYVVIKCKNSYLKINKIKVKNKAYVGKKLYLYLKNLNKKYKT